VILVIGASNLLGYEICRRLLADRERIRILVGGGTRSSRVAALSSAGAELVHGNLNHLPAVAAACQGADAVIGTDAAMLPDEPGEAFDRQCARNLVEFACALAIPRLIYVTVPRGFRTDCSLLKAREELMERLTRRRMRHSVLCANFFMETWLSPAMGFDHPNAKAVIFGDGTRPIAWVSCRDVAQMAVGCLHAENRRDGYLAVDGPENLTPLEAVRIFEEAAGRRFDVTHVAAPALEREYQKATDPATEALAALKLEYARGCPIDAHAAKPASQSLLHVKEFADSVRQVYAHGSGA